MNQQRNAEMREHKLNMKILRSNRLLVNYEGGEKIEVTSSKTNNSYPDK